jgi:hypothetical protein
MGEWGLRTGFSMCADSGLRIALITPDWRGGAGTNVQSCFEECQVSYLRFIVEFQKRAKQG